MGLAVNPLCGFAGARGLCWPDRGFGSDRLRSLLASLGAEAVVAPKSNRTAAIDCDM